MVEAPAHGVDAHLPGDPGGALQRRGHGSTGREHQDVQGLLGLSCGGHFFDDRARRVASRLRSLLERDLERDLVGKGLKTF